METFLNALSIVLDLYFISVEVFCLFYGELIQDFSGVEDFICAEGFICAKHFINAVELYMKCQTLMCSLTLNKIEQSKQCELKWKR